MNQNTLARLAKAELLARIAAAVQRGEFEKATAMAAMMTAGEMAVLNTKLDRFFESIQGIEIQRAPAVPMAKDPGSVN